MKIATEVKGYITVPPPADMTYAPYDIAVALTSGLVERGHEVDFFAPEGSRLGKGTLVTLGQPALVKSQQEYSDALFNIGYHSHNTLALYDQNYAAEMFRRARKDEYDVLHFHQPEPALAYVKDYPDVPVVYTMHDPISPEAAERLRAYHTDNAWVVSVSDHQRTLAPDLHYAATVYNGIDTDLFSFAGDKDDYLLFAARLIPEKGLKEAVEVARMTNQKLVILGQKYPDHEAYFQKYVEPYLGEQIRYEGYVPHQQAIPYFQKAKAFLMPIAWDEPFGLTMVEALSCGTPVIAFNRGAVPEIIVDGVTGYIVKNVQEMAEAVGKIDAIDLQACRDHVVANFSVDKMVRGYEAVYEKIRVC